MDRPELVDCHYCRGSGGHMNPCTHCGGTGVSGASLIAFVRYIADKAVRRDNAIETMAAQVRSLEEQVKALSLPQVEVEVSPEPVQFVDRPDES